MTTTYLKYLNPCQKQTSKHSKVLVKQEALKAMHGSLFRGAKHTVKIFRGSRGGERGWEAVKDVQSGVEGANKESFQKTLEVGKGKNC